MPDDFIKNYHGINIKYPASDQDKNAQKISNYIATLNRAKGKIRRMLIESDSSDDKSAIYTAVTRFKKTNE